MKYVPSLGKHSELMAVQGAHWLGVLRQMGKGIKEYSGGKGQENAFSQP